MSLIARCNGQSVFGNACNTVASLTKNFLAFATLLQVSRKTFWRLQQCCKSHEKLSGVCNTVASLTKNFLAFATLLQVSRKTFWRLQQCCKSREKLSGVCNTVASPAKNFSAFATPLQIEKTTLGPLHQWCKHFQKRFGPSRDFRRGSLLALFLHRARYEGQREASIRRPMASIPFSCSSRIP